MPIDFVCEGCGKDLSVKDEYAGRRGVCSQCGAIIVPPTNAYEVEPGPTRTKPDTSAIFSVGREPVGSIDTARSQGGPSRSEAIFSRAVAVAVLCGLGIACLGVYVGIMAARRPNGERAEVVEGEAPAVAAAVLANAPVRQDQVAPRIAAPVPPVPVVPVAPPSGLPLGVEEIVARCEAAVAVVRGPDSAGSGFLVAPGLLATNAHVIRGVRVGDLQVLFPSAPIGRRGPHAASVAYFDDDRDLAMLAVDSRLPPLPVDEAHAFRRGQEVVFIGSPVVGGALILENAAGRGILGSTARLDGLDFYQISGSVNGGNSGGPVIDTRGRVVGVVTARAKREEGLGFCVPAADLVVAMNTASSVDASVRADASARHAATIRPEAVRFAESGAPRRGGNRFVGDPPVLAPDASYRPNVGDMASVLRDETPAAFSWAAMDEFARKELAGDAAGLAVDLKSGRVVMLARRTDLDVDAINEPPAVRSRRGTRDFATNVNLVGDFNEKHPAGSVVAGRLLSGPHEGKTVYVARVDVGRFMQVLRSSPAGREALASAVRRPRRRTPAPDLAAKATSALELAEAIERAGRVEEAERAYRVIIREYPGTPPAERATAHVKVLMGR